MNLEFIIKKPTPQFEIIRNREKITRAIPSSFLFL